MDIKNAIESIKSSSSRMFRKIRGDGEKSGAGISWPEQQQVFILCVTNQTEALAKMVETTGARFADPRGMTPLMVAACHGLSQCVQALIDHSETNHVDPQGRSALHHAAMVDAECVASLVSVIDARVADTFGTTPLMCAAGAGNSGCLKALIADSDPMAQDFEGWTALMHAAQSGSVECVEALLPVSDPRVRNSWGQCAAAIASERGNLLALAKIEAVNLALDERDQLVATLAQAPQSNRKSRSI